MITVVVAVVVLVDTAVVVVVTGAVVAVVVATVVAVVTGAVVVVVVAAVVVVVPGAAVVVAVAAVVVVMVVLVFLHGRNMVHGILGTHKPFNLSAASNPSSMNAITGAGSAASLIATM